MNSYCFTDFLSQILDTSRHIDLLDELRPSEFIPPSWDPIGETTDKVLLRLYAWVYLLSQEVSLYGSDDFSNPVPNKGSEVEYSCILRRVSVANMLFLERAFELFGEKVESMRVRFHLFRGPGSGGSCIVGIGPKTNKTAS